MGAARGKAIQPRSSDGETCALPLTTAIALAPQSDLRSAADLRPIARLPAAAAAVQAVSLTQESQMFPFKDAKKAIVCIPFGSEFDSKHMPDVANAELWAPSGCKALELPSCCCAWRRPCMRRGRVTVTGACSWPSFTECKRGYPKTLPHMRTSIERWPSLTSGRWELLLKLDDMIEGGSCSR